MFDIKKIFFLICLFCILPNIVLGALININTANLDELDQITGVGPAIGGKIIDYRNTNGPFKTIDEIKNVSGIGDATFLKMKDQITVGGATVQPETGSANDSLDEDSSPEVGGRDLSVHTGETELSRYEAEGFKLGAGRDRLATVRTPLAFSASPNKLGKEVSLFTWSFGDGTSALGPKVYHAYQFPGTYNVVLNGVIDNKEEAVARTKVIVSEANLKITAIDLTAGYIEISNHGDKEQNLNSWSLQTGQPKLAQGKIHVFPLDTIISPKTAIKIPLKSIGFAGQDLQEVILVYPDGGVASGASLQKGPSISSLVPIAKPLAKVEPQSPQLKIEEGIKNLKNIVVLTKEPTWFEKIKNAIFK